MKLEWILGCCAVTGLSLAAPAFAQSASNPLGVTEPILVQAEAQLSMGRAAEAERLARTVVDTGGAPRTLAQAQAIIGRASVRRGDSIGATRAFQAALLDPKVFGPERPFVQIQYAKILYEAQRVGPARREAEAALDFLTGPDLGEAYLIIADYNLEKKQDARAAQAIDRAWRRVASERQALVRALAERLGQSGDAQDLDVGYSALHPTSIAASFLGMKLAERAVAAGKKDEAKALLEELKAGISQNPKLVAAADALRAKLEPAAPPPQTTPTVGGPDDPFPPEEGQPPAPAPNGPPTPAAPPSAQPRSVATPAAPPPVAPPQAPPQPTAPRSSVSAADAARLDQAIKKVGDNVWQMDRAFVDGIFSQNEPLGRCTRLYEQSGGYRIMCVEPGNLFDRMGLRNEDIILQINDVSLGNTITLFFGMGSLKSAPQLVTRINRGGAERVHIYSVR